MLREAFESVRRAGDGEMERPAAATIPATSIPAAPMSAVPPPAVPRPAVEPPAADVSATPAEPPAATLPKAPAARSPRRTRAAHVQADLFERPSLFDDVDAIEAGVA